ncbi:uncharacterized protein LOC132548374 [Ylistrum balloti]|uniref:uncharacterized protein LOC132548374 n=1 Tax=Ylistrum balloti TaxID=509963 RepID=UPI002905834D|nr:uncharacterized protein LOC132548374 [Ylistrum balloti]
MTSLAEKQKTVEDLRPPTQDYSHQDSLFGNAFSSRSNFIVHPEWLSENVDPPLSRPMNRPPWPWEQPKYRQNIKLSQLNGNNNTDEKTNKNGTGNGQTNETENTGGYEVQENGYAPVPKYPPSLYCFGQNSAYMDANGSPAL